MHQKITSLLAAVLAVLLLCSCGGQPSQQPNLPETPEEAPYAFTLDYHRCAPLVERQIGSDLAAAARLVVDAFLAGETSVTLPVTTAATPATIWATPSTACARCSVR